MELVSLFVPAAYVAALAWAIGGDFLRAQFDKDLENEPPSWALRALSTVSLPTCFLVGALLLRLLIHVKGLLLTALFLAAALSLWKVYRVWALGPVRPAASRRPLG
jgi:hypothetical protein